MKVYINYPNPHFTIHRDPNCRYVQMHGKKGRRLVSVTPENLGDVLLDFVNNKYRFAAMAGYNGLWLDISLGTSKHDESLVYIIQVILGRHYKPLRDDAPIKCHC